MSAFPSVIERVRLGEDPDGCVRRACPVCARHFKTRWCPSDDTVAHAAFMSAVEHANVDDLAETPRRHCPYCGHSAPATVFLTGSQRQYIEAWASHVISVMRYERLRFVEQRLSQNPYVTFLTVPVSDAAPEVQVEPNDLVEASFLCCGDTTKVLPNWRGQLSCHSCGTRQERSSR